MTRNFFLKMSSWSGDDPRITFLSSYGRGYLGRPMTRKKKGLSQKAFTVKFSPTWPLKTGRKVIPFLHYVG